MVQQLLKNVDTSILAEEPAFVQSLITLLIPVKVCGTDLREDFIDLFSHFTF
jgi:hypothetical protein